MQCSLAVGSGDRAAHFTPEQAFASGAGVRMVGGARVGEERLATGTVTKLTAFRKLEEEDVVRRGECVVHGRRRPDLAQLVL